jgi:hypothetical protein
MSKDNTTIPLPLIKAIIDPFVRSSCPFSKMLGNILTLSIQQDGGQVSINPIIWQAFIDALCDGPDPAMISAKIMMAMSSKPISNAEKE